MITIRRSELLFDHAASWSFIQLQFGLHPIIHGDSGAEPSSCGCLFNSAAMSFKPPDNFDFSRPEVWPTWHQRFLRYRTASKLATDSFDVQVSALIYAMGEDAENITAPLLFIETEIQTPILPIRLIQLLTTSLNCSIDISCQRSTSFMSELFFTRECKVLVKILKLLFVRSMI